MRLKPRFIPVLTLLSAFLPLLAIAGSPVTFEDAAGRTVSFDRPPQRVVSIVPAITEILFRIGAGEAVVGVTHHDTYPPEAATKREIGGFFNPSLDRIRALEADTIFVSDLHASVISGYGGETGPSLVQMPLKNVADLYKTIGLLGEIFHRTEAAGTLKEEIHGQLAHTATKTSAISTGQKKRVIRLMGRTRIMAPGDDSFQNELIRLAGGIPPTLGQNGAIVPVTLEDWKAFNPQVIYACGGDRKVAAKLFDQPGWRDVEAVRKGKIHYFPCELTCRLSSRTGYFVSCLAATIYGETFASLPPVHPDERLGSKPVTLSLDYVERAAVIQSRVNDYVHKTLVLDLKSPMSVSSTLEGFRENIRFVGNSYSPPQVWGLYHYIGLEASRKQLLDSIGRDSADTSMLFTGANMDNLSVQKQQYKKMVVYALVTAGVKSNAVRMAEDVGRYYEPGTINMVILSNMRLTPRAMNRAIISATEAKSAALQDMDLRSTYTPMKNPATGTGTDNIIVVEGTGTRIDNTGGHSKMGELIAKAVYAGVTEAAFKQNGLLRGRSVFHRLKERNIGLFGLVGDCTCGLSGADLANELERLLLEPGIAGFVQASLAISDRYERSLINDLSGFESWCDQVASTVAGKAVTDRQTFDFSADLPPVLELAFDALLNGIAARNRPVENR